MDQEEQSQIDAEEINIIEYIRIILKRKWLILGFLLVFLIGAGVFTFLFLTKYKAETLMEIGVVEGKLLENPTQVVEKIQGGVYGSYPGIKTENPKNTNLIKIDITSKNQEDAKKALENISKSILMNHNSKRVVKEVAAEEEIKRLQNKIASLETEKKNLEAQLDILEKIPPYQQTLTTQLALSDVRDRLERKEGRIGSLYLEISSLQRSIEDILPTKIIKDPTISTKAVKIRLLFNMVVAGILGLFAGIFLALGKEWWEKNRGKI